MATISATRQILLAVLDFVYTIIKKYKMSSVVLITFMALIWRGIRISWLCVSHVAVVVLWLQAQGEAVASMGVFGRSQETGQAQSHLKKCVKH